MKHSGEKLSNIIKGHIRDLNLNETTKKSIIENLTQEILNFIKDEYGKKVASHGQAVIMTHESSQSVDDMMLKKGKLKKPGTI